MKASKDIIFLKKGMIFWFDPSPYQVESNRADKKTQHITFTNPNGETETIRSHVLSGRRPYIIMTSNEVLSTANLATATITVMPMTTGNDSNKRFPLIYFPLEFGYNYIKYACLNQTKAIDANAIKMQSYYGMLTDDTMQALDRAYAQYLGIDINPTIITPVADEKPKDYFGVSTVPLGEVSNHDAFTLGSIDIYKTSIAQEVPECDIEATDEDLDDVKETEVVEEKPYKPRGRVGSGGKCYKWNWDYCINFMNDYDEASFSDDPSLLDTLLEMYNLTPLSAYTIYHKITSLSTEIDKYKDIVEDRVPLIYNDKTRSYTNITTKMAKAILKEISNSKAKYNADVRIKYGTYSNTDFARLVRQCNKMVNK